MIRCKLRPVTICGRFVCHFFRGEEGRSAAFSALVVQNIQSSLVPRTPPLALERERVPN